MSREKPVLVTKKDVSPSGQPDVQSAAQIRIVDGLHVYRYNQTIPILPWRHRPAVACHHVPVGDGSGRWVWAVCLGSEQPGGRIVRAVAVQQIVLTEPSDRRYRWLYDSWDGNEPSADAKPKMKKLADRMVLDLETCLAATLQNGCIFYRDSGNGMVRVWPHMSFSSITGRAERKNAVYRQTIDVMLTAYVVIVQTRKGERAYP